MKNGSQSAEHSITEEVPCGHNDIRYPDARGPAADSLPAGGAGRVGTHCLEGAAEEPRRTLSDDQRPADRLEESEGGTGLREKARTIYAARNGKCSEGGRHAA